MGLKHLNIFRYKKQDVSWTSTKKTALDYNDKPATTKNKTIMIKKKKKINEVVTTRYKMYQLILPDESFQQSKKKQTKKTT